MSTRFCSQCSTQVEDSGGYCLLGHPLRLRPVAVAASGFAEEAGGAGRVRDIEPPQVDSFLDEPLFEGLPPVAPPPMVSATGSLPAGGGNLDRDAGAAPPPSPPPPPPPPAATQKRLNPWAAFADDLGPASEDPMAAFSPAPRMDWGPERLSFLRRGPARRKLGAEVS